MNGYELTAETYKRFLTKKKDEMTIEEILDAEKKINLYDILAKFDDNDIYAAFDSGMFNSILKGYVQMSIDQLCEDENIKKAANTIKKKIIGKVEALLDTHGASDAEKYWYEN